MSWINKRITRLGAHPNLSALYETMPYHTRQIVEGFLETGATFPLMEKASQCMDAEFMENPILQILAHGNVLLMDAVTEVALDELEYLLATVEAKDEEL